MDLSKVALVVCHRRVLVSDDDQGSWLWDLSQRVWDPGIIMELLVMVVMVERLFRRRPPYGDPDWWTRRSGFWVFRP